MPSNADKNIETERKAGVKPVDPGDLHRLYLLTARVVTLSLMLYIFTIPHTLEDASVGEAQSFGLPPIVLAFGVAAILVLQGLGLFYLGQGNQRGFVIQALLGFAWAFAAAAVHLPQVFSSTPFREGAISTVLVFGIILVGLFLGIFSVQAIRAAQRIYDVGQVD